MNTFNEMDLPSQLLKACDSLGFTTPTPIQAQTVPLALQGKDILGSAKTGTGKTLAFALPLISNLLNNVESSALILAPTRELAQQIDNAIRNLMGGRFGIRTALLIGGESYGKQYSLLRKAPRIVVGTPGRIIDHLERETLALFDFDFLVLDETDRMFEMGMGEQVDEIISQMPDMRQTLMFSATFTPRVEKLAQKHLKTPERIFVDTENSTALNLTEEVVELKDSEKDKTLLKALQERDGSVIVFVKTKSSADRLARYLSSEDHSAAAIHGDLRQSHRERVMKAFRSGKYRIMVATDVAARGIDIPHIRHVVNYDMPHSPEDYIHRVGRTARAGAEGFALNFISSGDYRRWIAIQRLMHPNEFKRPERGPRDFERRPARGKPRFEKQRGEKSFFADKPQYEKRKSQAGKPSGESRFDKPRSAKPSTGKSFFSDKPQFEKRQSPEGKFSAESRFDKTRSDKPFSGKSRFEKRKSQAEKPSGESRFSKAAKKNKPDFKSGPKFGAQSKKPANFSGKSFGAKKGSPKQRHFQKAG